MNLAPLVRFAARHRRVLWIAVAALTLALALGLPRLRFETGVLDWLPASHPNVVAFRSLFDELEDAVNQELVWLEIDPDKAIALDVTKITDHRAFLAQEELANYIRERVPQVRGSFGILSLLEAAGGLRPGATGTGVPESAITTRVLWTTVRSLGKDYVDAIVSRDGTGTILSLILDTPAMSRDARDVGFAVEAALAEYRDDPSVEHDLFRDEYLVPTGLASGTAFIDRSLARDAFVLGPLSLAFLVLVLRSVLASWRAVAFVVLLVATGTTWTLGLMGWTGSPLNLVTIALVPLVLGCGINYSILVGIETADRKADGSSQDALLGDVGRSSATAVLLTTLTTTTGLLVLCLSDAPGLVSLGLHAAAGMTGLALLAILVLPTVQAELPPSRPGRFARAVATVAETLATRRVWALGAFVVIVGITAASMPEPVLLLDTLDAHFPPGSPVTRTLRRMRAECGGAFPEFIIATGDVTSSEGLEVLADVQRRVAESTGALGTFRSIGPHEVLAMARFRSLASPAESTDAEAAIEELRQSDALRPLVDMFVSRNNDLAVVILLGGDVGRDEHAIEALWQQLGDVVADASRSQEDPAAVRVSFLGYRTMARLFTTYSIDWLRRTGIVSMATVLLIAVFFLRNLRAAVVVGLIMAASSLLWLGLLELTGVYVSIFLLFPLVFLMSIGSDYALHVLCRMRTEETASRSVDVA